MRYAAVLQLFKMLDPGKSTKRLFNLTRRKKSNGFGCGVGSVGGEQGPDDCHARYGQECFDYKPY